uniref:Uncharacterized protein n=1 Tax=Arundo donax TaxID=35708 RepID=A0A0A9BWB2_ARUDO
MIPKYQKSFFLVQPAES